MDINSFCKSYFEEIPHFKEQFKTNPKKTILTIISLATIIIPLAIAATLAISILLGRARKGFDKPETAVIQKVAEKTLQKNPEPKKESPKEEPQIRIPTAEQIPEKAPLKEIPQLSEEELKVEFNRMPLGCRTDDDLVYRNQGCSRFSNIHCIKKSALQWFENDSDSSIHGNWVTFEGVERRYIAAQSPLPGPTTAAFLRKLRDEECSHLVWLVPPGEMIKKDLVGIYPLTYGEEKAEYRCISKLSGPHANRYTLQSSDTKHTLTIHQMDKWPDHGIVDPKDFLEFRNGVEEAIGTDQGPLAVTCRAGIGRTGTYIVTDAAIRLNQGADKIKGLLEKGREQRHAMIQTEEQYLLVHQVYNLNLSPK